MQYNIPVKIIILNNNFLGMVRQWQQLFFESRYSFTEMKNPDFIKLSQAFDIPAVQIKDRAKLQNGIQNLLQSKGPSLMEVIVEQEQNVFPMVPTGASVAEILLEAPK
jgi:acetolactate synthase-1/2/3 large subunit